MLQRCARGRLGRRRARYTRDARDKAKRIALARYERLMQYTTLSEIAEVRMRHMRRAQDKPRTCR